MIHYEYKTEEYEIAGQSGDHFLRKTLEDATHDGWELVVVFATGKYQHFAYFKRPLVG